MRTKKNTRENVQKNWKALEDVLKDIVLYALDYPNGYAHIENFLKSLKKEDLFELYKENLFRLSEGVHKFEPELDEWEVTKSERLNSFLSSFLVTNYNLTKREQNKVLFYNSLTRNINEGYINGFHKIRRDLENER